MRENTGRVYQLPLVVFIGADSVGHAYNSRIVRGESFAVVVAVMHLSVPVQLLLVG